MIRNTKREGGTIDGGPPVRGFYRRHVSASRYLFVAGVVLSMRSRRKTGTTAAAKRRFLDTGVKTHVLGVVTSNVFPSLKSSNS